MFNMNNIIYKKREGGELSREEIHFFITDYVAGRIPDYQAAALLMAIFFRGLSRRETFELTEAMRYSGDTVDLSSIPRRRQDNADRRAAGFGLRSPDRQDERARAWLYRRYGG